MDLKGSYGPILYTQEAVMTVAISTHPGLAPQQRLVFYMFP
jgi:hypothetical protein